MKNSNVLLHTFAFILFLFTSCEKENSLESLSPCFGVEAENFKLLTSQEIGKNYQYTSFFQSDRYLVAKAYTYPPNIYYFIIYDKLSHKVSEIEIPDYIGTTTILGNKIYFAYDSSTLSYVDLDTKTIHYTDINSQRTWGYIIQMQEFENNLGILFHDQNTGYYYNFLYDIQTNQMTPLYSANNIKGVKIGYESSIYAKVYKNKAQQTCLLFMFRDNSSINSYVYSINTQTGQDEYFQNVGYVFTYNSTSKATISNNHFLMLFNDDVRIVVDIQTGVVTEIDWIAGFDDYVFTKNGDILEGRNLSLRSSFPISTLYPFEILAFQKVKNKLLVKINDEVSLIDMNTKCLVKNLPDKSFEIIPDVNNLGFYYWDRIPSRKNVIENYEY